MGGGESKTYPPIIYEDAYPGTNGLKNLSLSASAAEECVNCDIAVDTKVTTSSITLTRENGDIAAYECKKWAKDLNAVRANEMSFQEFFNKLQQGQYHRPGAKTGNGQFCEQVMFSDDVAADVTDLASFDIKFGFLKVISIRKISTGGSFSRGTKATFKLSIPVTFEYTQSLMVYSG